jgi:hypothetical protein
MARPQLAPEPHRPERAEVHSNGHRRIVDLCTHPEPNVTPRQLADYWHKDIETIHRWIRKGALKARKVGTGPPASRGWVISTKVAREFEGWPE